MGEREERFFPSRSDHFFIEASCAIYRSEACLYNCPTRSILMKKVTTVPDRTALTVGWRDGRNMELSSDKIPCTIGLVR
jgi:hypothetical protein